MTGPNHEVRRTLALVRAATSEGERARSAWASRPDDFELDEIYDRELGRLLPAVGIALAGSGDPDLPRLRGMQRKRWVEHQVQAHALQAPLLTLAEHGVDVWITGGGLFARADWAYAAHPGLRWPDDTGLLVRPDDAERAHAVLVADGAVGAPPWSVARRLRLHDSTPIEMGNGWWTTLAWSPHRGLPAGFRWWEGGGTLALGDREVCELSPVAATIAVLLTAEFDRPGVSAVLDGHRLLAGGSVDRAEVLAVAQDTGVDGVVARWMGVLDAVADHGDDTWLAALAPPGRTGRLRPSWRTVSNRLGAARAAKSLPELWAERWHLERVRDIPVGLARRAGVRGRAQFTRSLMTDR